jgi:hypothetical protein
MPTYILLTKLSPEVLSQMKDRARLGRNWLEQVKKKCPEVKFISHYAILGSMTFWTSMKHPMRKLQQKCL